MRSLWIALVTLLTATGSTAGAEPAGSPSLELSEVRFANDGDGPRVIMVRPDGQGPALDRARDAGGNPVDATVEVYVRDWLGNGVEGFPWQDVWVMSTAGASPPSCRGSVVVHGMAMDAAADAEGRLVLAAPPAAGGWHDGDANAMVNGQFIEGSPLALRWNSPDLDGDLTVDLQDAGLFASDLLAGYRFRADLVHDGVLNVSDAGAFATALGASCP